MRTLHLPISEEDLQSLRAYDAVSFSGTLCRSATKCINGWRDCLKRKLAGGA